MPSPGRVKPRPTGDEPSISAVFTQLNPASVRLLQQLTFSTAEDGKLVIVVPPRLIESLKAREDFRVAVKDAAVAVGYTGVRWRGRA